MAERESLFDALDRIESALQRVPYNIDWIADEGEPAMEALRLVRQAVVRDPNELLAFIDAVSPFVRDVLDEPFPWTEGGQVIVRMTRWEYDEALAALGKLRD